jgi:hypothetical protein
MYRGEHVRGPLDYALSGLRHGDWGARGQENRLVAATQWQERQVVALDQHHLHNTIQRRHSLVPGSSSATESQY